MTNTFKKYTAGVYAMLSEDDNLQHGDAATIETRHGKEVNVTVWKKLGKHRDGGTMYSVTRDDGIDRKEWLKRKVERQQNAALRQEKNMADYHAKSRKHADFLSLGEPVKVGHHSERRHRKIIDDAWNNMGKSVAAADKAERHQDKAETLEQRLKRDINLDTPESVEFLTQRVADLEAQREAIKANPHEGWEVSNLGATIRRYKERLDTARVLWDLDYVKVPKGAAKKVDIDELLERCEGFFAFNEQQLTEGLQGRDRGDFIHFGAGLILPKANLDTFKKEFKKI